MKIYKSNYKYQLAFFILMLFSGFIFVSSRVWSLENLSAFSILTITILIVAWSLFLLWLPKEIIIRESDIEFKTLLTNKKISFSQIKSVKPYYSTKSKMWHGGSEEKANMLCIIQLKSNLLQRFILTDAINGYKELFHAIRAKLE